MCDETMMRERLVPLSALHSCEASVLRRQKEVQSMAKLLKTAIKSGAMPDDWTRQATKMLERTNLVKG